MSYYDASDKREEIKSLQIYANNFALLTREEEKSLTFEYWDLVKYLIPAAMRFKLHINLLFFLVTRKMLIENRLVNCNLRLVLSNAGKQAYVDRGLTMYDRVLAGLDGLIYCIRYKYNPHLGWKFSTYSTIWIKQRIGKAIEKYGNIIKTSGHIKGMQSKVRMVVREYMANPLNQGGRPTAETISELIRIKYDGLEISPDKVAELGRLDWKHLSLDETTEDSTMSLMDYLASDDSYQPEVVASQSETKEKVMELVSKLETNEALVLSYKYGLIDSIGRSGKQIAATLGITPKEYSLLEARAMSNLKAIMPADFIDLIR